MIVMIRHNVNDNKTNLALDWSDRPDVAVDPHVVLVLHQTIWLPDLCLYEYNLLQFEIDWSLQNIFKQDYCIAMWLTRVMVDMSAELIENMPGSLPGWTLKHVDDKEYGKF